VHGFTPSVALAARRAGKPVVFTEHGLLSLGAKWPSRTAIKQTAKGFFVRRDVAIVACVSHWVAEAAGARYRVAPERVVVAPDGAYLQSIRAERTRDETLHAEGIDASGYVMVVTARLVDFKRIDRLLDALALLRESGRAWTLLIAGSGPLEPALRAQCARLGIDDRVRFLGYRGDVWDLVGAADLVPVPSGLEAFGLVVIEAMALGRPVVAFANSGGPVEVIQQVGGGCLVDSVEALATVIERGRSREPLPGFKPLDQTRFSETYSIEAAAGTYADLYSTAMGRM
jgi:glycosyltransferase involved in cell wall biosynthesis